jgi:hypothetical protein
MSKSWRDAWADSWDEERYEQIELELLDEELVNPFEGII